MAMIDYGAIAWKNGKLISTEFFTPMKDTVEWTDNGELSLEDNYFVYIGDKNFTVAFYKSCMRIYNPNYTYDSETIFFGSEDFEGWKKWRKTFIVGGNRNFVEITVKKRKFHNYYICNMVYNNDKYKVAFGYGVDLGYYKKYKIIDYYGTPWFRVRSLIRDIKDKIKYGY